MRVRLICTSDKGDRKITGLVRYERRVRSAVIRNGADYTIASFDTEAQGPLQQIKDLIVRPVYNILRGSRETDITHVTYEFGSIYLPFILGRSVVTFHHIVSEEENNKSLWFFFWKLGAKMAVMRADRIIAISSQTQKEILERYQVPEEKVVVILTPQSEEFHVLPEVRKERRIGCMGALEKRKNHAASIRVFSGIVNDDRYSDFKLTIAGKGPLKDELVRYAEELGVGDRTEFISDLSSVEMTEFYNRCTLVLNTSGHEGIGMVTLEAQACGTPVLYFREAKIPKEVMAAAIPCTDEGDMITKATELLSDEIRYAEMRMEGIEYVSGLSEDFDSRLMAVYDSVRGMK